MTSSGEPEYTYSNRQLDELSSPKLMIELGDWASKQGEEHPRNVADEERQEVKHPRPAIGG